MSKFVACKSKKPFIGYHKYSQMNDKSKDKCGWCGDERATQYIEPKLREMNLYELPKGSTIHIGGIPAVTDSFIFVESNSSLPLELFAAKELND